MEQNTNRLLWAVGILAIGALLLGGGSVLAKENFLPKISQAFVKVLEDKNNVKSVEEADGYIVAKIRDEDKTKNESAIYIFLTKNDDGTLTIHHARNDRKLTIDDEVYFEGEGPLTGSTGDLYIPDKVNGLDITKIGEGAFQSADFSGKLKLPSTLKEISSETFLKSKFTGKLSLPGSIKVIGYSAFMFSTFTGELNLPQNIEYIGDGAFYYSTFTGTFESRSNLKSIGGSAFGGSNFTGDFKGFESLEEIGGGAFQSSTFNGSFVTPSSLKKISTFAFEKSKFTGTLDVSNISTIDGWAFNNSLFTQVNNPRNLHTTGLLLDDEEQDSIGSHAIRLSTGEYYLN